MLSFVGKSLPVASTFCFVLDCLWFLSLYLYKVDMSVTVTRNKGMHHETFSIMDMETKNCSYFIPLGSELRMLIWGFLYVNKYRYKFNFKIIVLFDQI